MIALPGGLKNAESLSEHELLVYLNLMIYSLKDWNNNKNKEDG